MTRAALVLVLSMISMVSALAGCASVDGTSGGTTPATTADPATAPSAPPDATAPATAVTPSTGLVSGRTATDSRGLSFTITPVTLRRQGGLVLLELAGRNNDPDQDANLGDLIRRADSLTFDSATLIDTVNRKRYLVARDSGGACLCTSFLGGLVVKPGQSGLVSAYFAAPPDTVRTVDVEVPGVGVFPGVPVS